MYLPDTYLAALLLIVFSILCWGSWANLLKLGGWRFELFYYDFASGALLCATIAAFTFGMLNPKELTFQENLLISSYRSMACAFGAGMLFNFGNMLLAAAISISGMSVVFPIAIGVTLAITGAVRSYLNTGSFIPLAGGAVVALAASILAAMACSARARARTPAFRPGGAIALSVFAGVLMAGFYPILRFGAWGEAGVGPYGTALLFGGGIWLSTLLLNPFFLNFPVQGKPVEVRAYFSGGRREHVCGLFAGMIWMAGAVANFAVVNLPFSFQLSPAASYELGQGAAVAAALWGLFAWREFRVSGFQAKLLLIMALVCLAFAIALMAVNFGA